MKKSFFIFFTILFGIIGLLSLRNPLVLWALVLVLPLFLLGLADIFQKKHTIRSNFPILGRLRYFMEDIRPKIYQYFVESDTNGAPFNRLQRSLIYQRSKSVSDKVPFGTQLNVYEPGYEWINHSISAKLFKIENEFPRIRIGSSQCQKPYDASLFNISAMSFGSLSKTAISALNLGAMMGKFYHNTGEGGLSDYHLLGGDVVWNIGTGYFSCRDGNGNFSEIEFEKRAKLQQVKMIEIKFSQGAKPGHGGILPKSKITDEIARIRMVGKENDVLSPPFHSAFSNPIEFVHFANKLRELSGGKPVGMKICIGKKEEFLSICKAMVQEKIYIDFITVDGGEGGTGSAPLEFTDHVGMPLKDAIAFVYDALVGFGIKNEIKIIASGKIFNGFEIVKALSLGADLCNSARGMMMALGCIQALECHKNTCPTGIATQDPSLYKGLDPTDKKVRVYQYHKNTVFSAMELIYAAGKTHIDQIDRKIVHQRINSNYIATYEELYPELTPGCLLQEEQIPENFKLYMNRIELNKWVD